MRHHRPRKFRVRSLSLGVTLTMIVGLLVASSSPSLADVTGVTGSAYGYYTNVGLFGGPQNAQGPEPTVTLASDASNSPQDASQPTGGGTYGPAVIFPSGPLTVHTDGALGAGGSVNSTADVQGAAPDDERAPLFFDSLKSSCTADADGATGSVSVTNGRVESRPDDTQPVVTTPVPASPAANFSISGVIENVGDNYEIVFNEQTTSPDGTLTVNAAHMYLNGPTAVGEAIFGQVVCGVTATATTTTTTTTVPPTTTTTTVPPTTTTTTVPPTTTTTTVPPPTTTTTTVPPPTTTTTTVPPPTTTTTTVPPPPHHGGLLAQLLRLLHRLLGGGLFGGGLFGGGLFG